MSHDWGLCIAEFTFDWELSLHVHIAYPTADYDSGKAGKGKYWRDDDDCNQLDDKLYGDIEDIVCCSTELCIHCVLIVRISTVGMGKIHTRSDILSTPGDDTRDGSFIKPPVQRMVSEED